MIAYGTISGGQRVTVVRGTGYSFTIHDCAGAKNKTPQASGAGEARIKTYTTRCRPLCETVKQKINILA